MKTLIIGGNGYIGSNLTISCHTNNINVTKYGSRTEDYNKLKKEYLSQFDYIILLAGHSSVQMCVGDIKSSWLNNVRNFSNLVEKTPDNVKIFYASSASVYGNSNTKIFTEDDICLDVVNNYDITKITLDIIAQKFISQGRKIMGLRFGTVNGDSSVIRRDLMINSMVYTAMTDNKIYITNKKINRPILALKDLTRAIIHVIREGTFQPGIYNLASFNSTVEEISWSVEKHTGVKIIDKGDREGVYNFAIDATKFKSVFNFVFSENMESVVQDVIDCYKHRLPKIVVRNEYFKYD